MLQLLEWELIIVFFNPIYYQIARKCNRWIIKVVFSTTAVSRKRAEWLVRCRILQSTMTPQRPQSATVMHLCNFSLYSLHIEAFYQSTEDHLRREEFPLFPKKKLNYESNCVAFCLGLIPSMSLVLCSDGTGFI